jgi:hypothetical protein
MIGFINTTLTIFLTHNQLWQFTINDCLRLAPFCWTATAFSSTVTELVLIYESLTPGLRMNCECRLMTHLRISKDEWGTKTEWSQNQSHIATDGQSISKSWCRAPSGDLDQIFISLWQSRSCLYGAPSLTRGRFCVLYTLLGLASAVFLGSESFGSRDHNLLSQFFRLPFSTPPTTRRFTVEVFDPASTRVRRLNESTTCPPL